MPRGIPVRRLLPACALVAAAFPVLAAGPCHRPGQGNLCAMLWEGMTPERAAEIDPQVRYVAGLRPLQLAATFAEDPAVIDALLAAGAPLDARDANGNTALISAAKLSDSPERVRRLLEAGADVTARNTEGETALHAAAGATNEPAIIDLLVAAGAPLEAAVRNRWDGATPFLYAALWNTNPAVIRVLADAGAATDATIREGQTALHLAAGEGRTPVMLRALVEHGGLAPDARDAAGATPLHAAAVNLRTPEMTRRLLALGCEPSARRASDGRTPLHVAATAGHAEAVRALLAAGADARAEDDSGRRALDLAEGLEGSAALEALRRATLDPGI
jgi:ankyrin repeat protein